MANPFEAFLFRGRSSNLTNANRIPTPVIVIDEEDDAIWDNKEEAKAKETVKVPARNAAVPEPAGARASGVSYSQEDALLLGGSSPATASAKPQRRVQLVAQMPWMAKLSSERSEKIVSVFEANLCNYLLDNPVVYKAFGPFVSSKYVNRHANEEVRIEEAPAIDATHIRCQPGHSLRHYQLDGVRFLLDNFHKGMSSILADDMGLGKTAQVCSFLQVLHTLHGIQGPHLIVVPLTTITNWTRELARWAPSLHVLKYHGSKDFRMNCGFSSEHRHSVILTTPATLVNDKDVLRARTWVTLMVDEAHVLKNESTSVVSACAKMTAVMRLSITGTPFQNNLGEMWTQMNVLFPYIATKRFEIDEDDEGTVTAVKDVLKFIMIRRTKSQLDLGLPPRVDEPTMMIEPTASQRRILDAIRQCAEGGDVAIMKRLLMELRKVCNHPMLLKLLADPGRSFIRKTPHLSQGIARLHSAGLALSEDQLVLPSAKMIKLDHMLSQLKRDGHRVLIFSNFTSQLDIIEGLCAMRSYSYERLDGDCTRAERELSMLRYNNKESKVFAFLLTTTAGGVGVTLTGADTVIIFDCHFNPQLDRQAADRAHRIGQTRTVYVYRMCLKGTAEEKIQAISLRKETMGDLVLEGGTTRSGDQTILSVDEIKSLLSMGYRDISDEEVSVQEQELIKYIREGKGDYEDSVIETQREIVDFSDFRTNICFTCGEVMKPLEPLKMCDFCPKGYHPDCLPQVPKKTAKWSCPRHSCSECDKSVTSDGALFLCSSCPAAFCFDCLDPRYYASLDATGTSFRDISSSYYGMKEEGMEPKRTLYYVTCLHCAGVEASETETASSNGGSFTDAVTIE